MLIKICWLTVLELIIQSKVPIRVLTDLPMQVFFHKNDIPSDVLTNISSVAIDTETMGLLPHRDRLCLVQLSSGDNICHLVQTQDYQQANNLCNLLSNERTLKIFHYARFDITMLYKYLGVMTKNLYCTKIASKLVRTYTNAHSLKTLCLELLGIEISKEATCTDWGNLTLTDQQKTYASADVLYLHKIKEKLDVMLEREKRADIAQKCFDFLETRAFFDLTCGSDYDIFSHH